MNEKAYPPDIQQLLKQITDPEELALAHRLLDIEDPFEGWLTLAEEVSKVWPKGVSAVEAIREQRGYYD